MSDFPNPPLSTESGQPPAITIRRMTPEDVSQVLTVERLAFSLPWSERAYRNEFNNDHARLWVVEVQSQAGDRQIAGMMVVWIILDEMHIANIATHPDYRRMGIARRLLAHGIRSAAKEGVVSAYLEVRRGNHAAQALYRQFGFEEVGIRKGYYKDTHEDAVLMTLSRV